MAVLRLREGNDYSTQVVHRGRYDQALNFEDANNSAVRSKCFFLQAYVQTKQLGGKASACFDGTLPPPTHCSGTAHLFELTLLLCAGAAPALQRLPPPEQSHPGRCKHPRPPRYCENSF